MRGITRGCVRIAPLAAVLVVGAGSAQMSEQAQAGAASCRRQEPGRSYVARIDRALRSKQDTWGNELLAAPEGPTYQGVRRFVTPLLLAAAPGQRPATESGVHYLALGQPDGARGADTVALTVADGSQIVSDRINGPRLTVGVGDRGSERYGSCLSRLSASRLAGGWLPILDTAYTDSLGVRYRQESFVARVPGHTPTRLVRRGRRRRPRGDGSGRAASRSVGGLGADVRDRAGNHPEGPGQMAGDAEAERAGRGRSRELPGSQTVGDRVLDAPARGRGRDRGAGAARGGCVAEPARPGPHAHLALQHRKPVRGVLVPRGRRRRAGR